MFVTTYVKQYRSLYENICSPKEIIFSVYTLSRMFMNFLVAHNTRYQLRVHDELHSHMHPLIMQKCKSSAYMYALYQTSWSISSYNMHMLSSKYSLHDMPNMFNGSMTLFSNFFVLKIFI